MATRKSAGSRPARPGCTSGREALDDGRADSRYAFGVSEAPPPAHSLDHPLDQPPDRPLDRVARYVREHEHEIAAAWRDAFERSPVRVPRPGVAEMVAPLLRSMLDGLALALATGPAAADALVPGLPALRELEKNTGFAGATMAAADLSGFDVAALLLALRDVLTARVGAEHAPLLQRLFEWLSALALDAFATARVMTARERMRVELEQGTPVVLIAPRVPGVFLVGAPDRHTLDLVFDRAVVLVVTQDAPSIIVDASGLANPSAPGVLDGLGRFASHERIAGRAQILAVGLADEHALAWTRLLRDAGATMHREERFRDALEIALERLGWRLTSDPA
jgi:hypothetical protein